MGDESSTHHRRPRKQWSAMGDRDGNPLPTYSNPCLQYGPRLDVRSTNAQVTTEVFVK